MLLEYEAKGLPAANLGKRGGKISPESRIGYLIYKVIHPGQ